MPELNPRAHESLAEARALRDRAAAVLESLLRSREDSEARLARTNNVDAMKTVRGESSLDAAITTTRGTLDTLNSLLEERSGRNGVYDSTHLNDAAFAVR